jgi:2-polyprenyl-3-methyl-5-hydroxy-6-metoxy-1,4-benzoquinol methylase
MSGVRLMQRLRARPHPAACDNVTGRHRQRAAIDKKAGERSKCVSSKSSTDRYWNQRAVTERDPAKINMPDTVQRDFELTFVFKHLWPAARLAEIGCGNGYVTQQLRARVAHVDSFDYAENMIERARMTYGETNNRFFLDNVLDPKNIKGPYDAALCVRVLMKLRDLGEQKIALCNVAQMLRPGGRLILIEGFCDGFDALNSFRKTIGLAPLIPAAHNFYSYLAEILPTINEHFLVEQTWHTGLYDFLTRVVFPQLVGAENATRPGDFHSKIEPIVRANAWPDMARFARVHGFALARR